MTKPQTLRLSKRIAGTLRGGHPWIYRDALHQFDAPPGTEVRVESKRGNFVARGVVDDGPIAVRVFSTLDEPLGGAFLRRRLLAAFALRDSLDLHTEALGSTGPTESTGSTTALRMCNGEGDRLPGIAIDEYGDIRSGNRTAVLRLDGQAAASISGAVTAALIPILEARGVTGLLRRFGRRGHGVECAWGTAPPQEIVVKEYGMKLVANLWDGQKTGLFLDHRESRRRVRGLAKGLRVLNLYAYTGGFSVAAGLGGASKVTSVDVAPKAIELADASWAENELPKDAHHAVASDVHAFLENESNSYDLIISDPPSFAPNEESVPRAEDAYARLHQACLARLVPGGVFLAASCSSHIRGTDFDNTVRSGARKAGRVLQVFHRSGPPDDHPRLLAFPEGDYLDSVFCRVLA